MIRHSLRTLCAASLVIAPLALSSPAQAATSCSVNGVPASGPTVNGTAGSDFIQCSSVDAGHSVNGLGGSDTIFLTGPVNGTVNGGTEGDFISVGASAAVAGVVAGGDGGDHISVGGLVTPPAGSWAAIRATSFRSP
ncbi:hypothetical protein [Streptomyces sp. LN785]|uniref:hypothetical protein n=1 Tax=Streptomyces sp. LN785 TaxID=3112983 RepID=UPI00371789C8